MNDIPFMQLAWINHHTVDWFTVLNLWPVLHAIVLIAFYPARQRQHYQV